MLSFFRFFHPVRGSDLKTVDKTVDQLQNAIHNTVKTRTKGGYEGDR